MICGCGFTERVPFLPEDVQDRITEEKGNFQLYRQIKPVDVPNLTSARLVGGTSFRLGEQSLIAPNRGSARTRSLRLPVQPGQRGQRQRI